MPALGITCTWLDAQIVGRPLLTGLGLDQAPGD